MFSCRITNAECSQSQLYPLDREISTPSSVNKREYSLQARNQYLANFETPGPHQVDSSLSVGPHAVEVPQKQDERRAERTSTTNTGRNPELNSPSCKPEHADLSLHSTQNVKEKRACLEWETACFVCFYSVFQRVKTACEPTPCGSRFSTTVFLKLQVASKILLQKMHSIYFTSVWWKYLKQFLIKTWQSSPLSPGTRVTLGRVQCTTRSQHITRCAHHCSLTPAAPRLQKVTVANKGAFGQPWTGQAVGLDNPVFPTEILYSKNLLCHFWTTASNSKANKPLSDAHKPGELCYTKPTPYTDANLPCFALEVQLGWGQNPETATGIPFNTYEKPTEWTRKQW